MGTFGQYYYYYYAARKNSEKKIKTCVCISVPEISTEEDES